MIYSSEQIRELRRRNDTVSSIDEHNAHEIACKLVYCRLGVEMLLHYIERTLVFITDPLARTPDKLQSTGHLLHLGESIKWSLSVAAFLGCISTSSFAQTLVEKGEKVIQGDTYRIEKYLNRSNQIVGGIYRGNTLPPFPDVDQKRSEPGQKWNWGKYHQCTN